MTSARQAAVPQLSREVILRATVALIEAEGLGKLTMRRLGKALGVEAMAIYRYFPSRQHLITALADWIVLETATDPQLQFDAATDWRDYLGRLAHGIRRMALTHPRTFPIIASTPTEAPWIRPPIRSLKWVDSFLSGLLDHGFPPAAAVTVYKQFCSFLLGHLLLEVAALGTDGSTRSRSDTAQSDTDRAAAETLRSRRAHAAAAAMRHGDGPDAAEIVQSADDRPDGLAEEPVVQAAEPEIASEVEARDSPGEVDAPVAAALTATGELDLDELPQVRALADLLAEDTAPRDFEAQLDRLLDAIASLRAV